MSNPSKHLNDEIDLIELLQNLWDGKWVIAGVSAAAVAIGSAYVALTPNSFDASITVRPLYDHSASDVIYLGPKG